MWVAAGGCKAIFWDFAAHFGAKLQAFCEQNSLSEEMSVLNATRRYHRTIVVALLCFTAAVTLFVTVSQVTDYNLQSYHEAVTNFAKEQYSQYSKDVAINPEHRARGKPFTVDRLKQSPLKTGKSAQEIFSLNQDIYDRVLEKKINQPKGYKLSYKSDFTSAKEQDYEILADSAFVSLVRNSELEGIVSTIKTLEETFNSKYNYPYIFLNDKPFTQEFKDAIAKVTKAQISFEEIPAELWDKPGNIDPEKEKAGLDRLEEFNVNYAKTASYHNMCRFYSVNFYKLEALKSLRYYWRIEPDTKYLCDIDYDMFKFMRDNDKVYGFVIALYDSPHSIETLWPTTLEFLEQNPSYLHPNSASIFMTENLQNPDKNKVAHSYSTCHFWSNFEIGDMHFFRDEAYSKYAQHLEDSGGFYYERWGDAPIHSIGVSLFADKNRIHWFRDVGYYHFPYYNCPNSRNCNKKCVVSKFSDISVINTENCMPTWIEYEMSDRNLNGY